MKAFYDFLGVIKNFFMGSDNFWSVASVIAAWVGAITSLFLFHRDVFLARKNIRVSDFIFSKEPFHDDQFSLITAKITNWSSRDIEIYFTSVLVDGEVKMDISNILVEAPPIRHASGYTISYSKFPIRLPPFQSSELVFSVDTKVFHTYMTCIKHATEPSRIELTLRTNRGDIVRKIKKFRFSYRSIQYGKG